MKDKLKEFFNYLDKHTPAEGGCMVCLAKSKIEGLAVENGTFKYDKDGNLLKEIKTRSEYLLVERHKITNGDMFTINKRFFYDYDFLWDAEMPWEILYKKIV